ncbi:hypothetical protein WA026_016657 [Henosepilachna vigintioctopunctata]|uniref:Uncharacterized protein n=1 Tax=Henosepilachna vigintioctopunctata TaxID=420089 RepID=A0AAW1V2D4_9CUCU
MWKLRVILERCDNVDGPISSATPKFLLQLDTPAARAVTLGQPLNAWLRRVAYQESRSGEEMGGPSTQDKLQ